MLTVAFVIKILCNFISDFYSIVFHILSPLCWSELISTFFFISASPQRKFFLLLPTFSLCFVFLVLTCVDLVCLFQPAENSSSNAAQPEAVGWGFKSPSLLFLWVLLHVGFSRLLFSRVFHRVCTQAC